ncbi:hypothetical protein [Oscillatoria sp. FACHB-1406]|uniref:hypothetical protein n=1 Tax=Oscillatoria sp. FACHB-1406 TaxID=2692846 RepID=UPI001686228D|nr:hypothetical protein [Oscillatoria sp. FACHB-1406]MBD2577291.1 hypothetical protein [Oscillatoria sp. FACHB-1406]
MLQDISSDRSPSSVLAELPARDCREPIRHILIGSARGVQHTIYRLHTLGYAEVARWTHAIAIPDNQIIITPDKGEVMSLLVKSIRLK